MSLNILNLNIFDLSLDCLPHKKLLINTINAHSYNIAQKDSLFAKALYSSGALLPDGISIVFAIRLLKNYRIKKIAGADLFFYEMERLNKTAGKCFFLGSSTSTLNKIIVRAAKEYPNVKTFTYSPPFAAEFTDEENNKMVETINTVKPDVLFVGMTAPKQEKWTFSNFERLETGHVCTIGAVFDFYAGNIKRAPEWMIKAGMEWLYRLMMEPRRLWKRYLIGNVLFIWFILKEKFASNGC
jgi:N-acetylglucosaminyldiphosphoundecaprenol N-acetyl-beta-D-mannosaminyltransferase